MKIGKPEVIILSLGLLICTILGLIGLWAMLRPDIFIAREPQIPQKLRFPLNPGEERRATAYVVGGGATQFSSTAEGGSVNYRLKLDDGHSGSVLTETTLEVGQSGTLRPRHGTLYEWSWLNRSSRPASITLNLKGDFDLVRQTRKDAR